MSRGISEDRLEDIVRLFEEKQSNCPVMCVTSEEVIAIVAPYFDQRYRFDTGLHIECVGFTRGFLFDFDKKGILSLPKGYSIK